MTLHLVFIAGRAVANAESFARGTLGAAALGAHAAEDLAELRRRDDRGLAGEKLALLTENLLTFAVRLGEGAAGDLTMFAEQTKLVRLEARRLQGAQKYA